MRDIESTLNNRPIIFIYEKLEKSFQHQADIGRKLNTISINESEDDYTHFEDTFICLSKILVDFRNRSNKEYLLQLGEHFKYKNEKGWDTCNEIDFVFVYEPNKKEQILKQV